MLSILRDDTNVKSLSTSICSPLKVAWKPRDSRAAPSLDSSEWGPLGPHPLFLCFSLLPLYYHFCPLSPLSQARNTKYKVELKNEMSFQLKGEGKRRAKLYSAFLPQMSNPVQGHTFNTQTVECFHGVRHISVSWWQDSSCLGPQASMPGLPRPLLLMACDHWYRYGQQDTRAQGGCSLFLDHVNPQCFWIFLLSLLIPVAVFIFTCFRTNGSGLPLKS